MSDAINTHSRRETLYRGNVSGNKTAPEPPARKSSGATERKPRAQKPQPSRVQRARQATVRVVGEKTRRGASRTGNIIGGFVVLLTGAGIAFALLRNPKILTVPIQFVSTVVSKLSTFGTVATPPIRTQPQPSQP